MSGSTTLPTPICTIDDTGLHVPSFGDVLNWMVAVYQGIYGIDVYLGNDSQDGQFVSLIALAIHDLNSSVAAAYAAYSPQTARGEGLSSVVKINNIRRILPSNSSADTVIVGQNGTQIINGVLRDENNNNWLLPSSITIPASGTITVTAIAATPGQIEAGANTITRILTGTRGWQSATNPNPARPGDAIETDAGLRQRQTVSTALPSQSVLDGMVGEIANLPGVIRYAPYENDTPVTDLNGIPRNSVAMVIDGGDAISIAQVILRKKTVGSGTYGTTSEIINDTSGRPHTINFFRPTLVPINVALTIDPQAGYVTSTADLIVAAIADYLSSLPIGTSVLRTKIYSAANLTGALSATFNVISLTISRAGPPASADVAIAFNEAAVCTIDNVSITVLVH
jgi:uncharacterized phage protein gp47/JayE